jgi:hypothetical protein
MTLTRIVRRVQADSPERGSLLLVFFVILVSAVISTLIGTAVLLSNNSTRRAQSYTLAGPPADSGIQAALYAFNSEGATPTSVPSPPSTTTCPSTPATAGAPDWGATQDSSDSLIWHVTSVSCQSGQMRVFHAELAQQPRFALAAFSDSGSTTHGASSSITSYGPNDKLGIIGSNGAITFTGNTSVNQIDLYDYQGSNATLSRCSGNPCSYPGGGVNGTIVYTQTAPYPLTSKDVAPGATDPTAFITDQLNACIAANGPLKPWVASAYGGVLTYTGQPQCYSSMDFDEATTTNGTTTSPIQLYVQGNVTMTMNSTNANVNYTGQANPDAAGLQIYMLGSAFSVVNKSTFVGSVWAPNATCAGNPSSAQATIYGSLVCGAMGDQGGWTFDYDSRLYDELGNGQWSVEHYQEG